MKQKEILKVYWECNQGYSKKLGGHKLELFLTPPLKLK